jgi:hypothetical protein
LFSKRISVKSRALGAEQKMASRVNHVAISRRIVMSRSSSSAFPREAMGCQLTLKFEIRATMAVPVDETWPMAPSRFCDLLFFDLSSSRGGCIADRNAIV